MSQELMKNGAPPRALTLAEDEANAVRDAFAVNIASGSITEFDLPRIKAASGTALWLIPTLEGEETAPAIECVIVHARDTRAYFPTKDGNQPPQCSSLDSLTGKGDPGGVCASCSLAQWDSAQDGGAGQACKQSKQLFILRGQSMFLEVLTLPPTSLKAIKQFFLKLTTQGVQYHRCIIRIELEKAQNAQGKTYGKAVMKFVRRLSDQEALRALEFRALAQSISERVSPADAGE